MVEGGGGARKEVCVDGKGGFDGAVLQKLGLDVEGVGAYVISARAHEAGGGVGRGVARGSRLGRATGRLRG